MKTINIEEENSHILWITWEISMKFSVKLWLKIILKVKKKQGFTFRLENKFLEKLLESDS